MQDPAVTITTLTAGEDPSITVYHIELQASGIWTETFGTSDLTQAFLRGVQAAYGINGSYPHIPDFPAR